MHRLFTAFMLLLVAAPFSTADDELFEKSIRPVLVEKCLDCHSKVKSKGGLRLDTRAEMLKGGDGGAVAVPGKPRDSRLIEAVKQTGDLKMPPTGKLTDSGRLHPGEQEQAVLPVPAAHGGPHADSRRGEVPREVRQRSLQRLVEEVDWSVGQVLDTLRELKLSEKTLVVFTSDNGPWLIKGADVGSARPLRAGKGTTREGGGRVPTIAWWPAQSPRRA